MGRGTYRSPCHAYCECGVILNKKKKKKKKKIDNNGALELSKNAKHHDLTKHIDIRHHFIREAIERKEILLEHVPSNENTADIFTKSLPREAHQKHCKNLGLRSALA